MRGADSQRPTALVSYSHDSPEHERRVLELCNRLRARGIDAFVDQFLPGAPSEGWPLWMERQIEGREFTLMVCTDAYRRRFMEDETAGAGRGVVWEARILRNLLYEDSERAGRIVPVLLDSEARQFVPTVFRGHFYDVSDERGFESLLRHLLREPAAEAGALGSLGPQGSRWSAFERPWLVPDAMRTHYFTGRAELLERLRGQLVERRRAALHGLGGVGKTQCALEYAVRHRADYPDGVFWVNAATVSACTSGFVEIAQSLGIAAAVAESDEKIVAATLAWFDATNRWLLVLDNVDDRRDVAAFLPQRGAGHILLTSRESVFGELGIARALEVADLDAGESLRFLLDRTGRDGADPEERAAAVELARELGNLPLALAQAAAYVSETSAAFADYLAAFRKRRVALLEKAGGLLSHEGVAVTWAANFEAIERASPAAADVLRAGAFFAPDAIPFEIFSKGAPALGERIAAVLTDPDDLAMSELLRPLARYSLVRLDVKSRVFGIHRLVQEIVRSSLTEAERRRYVERAAGALNAALPEKVVYANWSQSARLVPHIETIGGWFDAYELHSAEVAPAFNRAGAYLWERGRHTEALALWERALTILERALGPDHLDVALNLNNVAIVYWFQGRYGEAQALHERALAIRERALGPDHTDVAASLTNLAIVYCSQGRYEEARSFHERALAVQESALGSDHVEVAAILINLGEVHFDTGRYAEAQALYERALALREPALGPDHPEVGLTLCAVAETLRAQGRYAEARALQERALVIRERALGPDRPDVAASLDGLGQVSEALGRHDEAQSFHERALAIRERALGPEHLAVAESLIGLATVHRHAGRLALAEPMLERAVTISERALNPQNPKLARALAALAALREDQGRNAEALALFERALAIKVRTFAADHPEIVEIARNIDALRARAG